MYVVCWLVSCQYGTSSGHLARQNLNWEKYLHQIACRRAYGDVFLVSDWCVCGRARLSSLWAATLGLRCICKRAEQATGNKLVSSVPPWFLLWFPPLVPTPTSLLLYAVRLNKTIPPQVALVMMFITAKGSKLRHVLMNIPKPYTMKKGLFEVCPRVTGIYSFCLFYLSLSLFNL